MTVSAEADQVQFIAFLPVTGLDWVKQVKLWISRVGSFLGSAAEVVTVIAVEFADHTPTPVSTPCTQMV